MAPKKNPRHTRANPDPNPPIIVDNPNTIPRNIRKQERQDQPAVLTSVIDFPNLSTPLKVLFRSIPSSPSSQSTSQSSPPPSSSTAHIPLNHTLGSASPVTPGVPTIPIIPATPINTPNPPNMANRYAPLQLPANLQLYPRITKPKSHSLTPLALTLLFNMLRGCKITLKTMRSMMTV